MRKFLLLIILAVFTVPGIIFSLDSTLSLEDARALALLNSRSLARFNLIIQSNQLSEKTQYYANLPSLSLGASASANLWTKDGSSMDIIKDSFDAGASLKLDYTYKIWDGGKYAIQKAINSLNTESSRQDALAEYYSVLSTADSAYYSVLEALASLEAAESSLETANLSLSMAEIRQQSGMISDISYLQALADRATKETSRNQSRRDLALAQLKLKDLLGISELPGLEPVDFASREELILLLSNIDDAGLDRLYTGLWKEMQARNPSMVKAAINSQKSEKNLTMESRAYSPTLSASFNTGIGYTMKNGLEPANGRLSLNANFPLDFWVISSNVEKSKISQAQTALDYRSTVSSLDIELQTDLLDLISQAGQILSSRQALDYAQKHFDYVLELYRLSRNSPSDLSDAETLIRNSRNQLNRSQYTFLTMLSRIRSIGAFDSDEAIMALVRETI